MLAATQAGVNQIEAGGLDAESKRAGAGNVAGPGVRRGLCCRQRGWSPVPLALVVPTLAKQP